MDGERCHRMRRCPAGRTDSVVVQQRGWAREEAASRAAIGASRVDGDLTLAFTVGAYFGKASVSMNSFCWPYFKMAFRLPRSIIPPMPPDTEATAPEASPAAQTEALCAQHTHREHRLRRSLSLGVAPTEQQVSTRHTRRSWSCGVWLRAVCGEMCAGPAERRRPTSHAM